MFQQQPAAGDEVVRGAGDDAAEVVQPVRAGSQCLGRLEAQVALHQMSIAGGDVGRVAGDQVEAVATERTVNQSPRRNHTLLMSFASALRVATANVGPAGSVATTAANGRSRAMDRAMAPLPVPRSATCQRFVFGQPGQRLLDQQLGFRARDRWPC